MRKWCDRRTGALQQLLPMARLFAFCLQVKLCKTRKLSSLLSLRALTFSANCDVSVSHGRMSDFSEPGTFQGRSCLWLCWNVLGGGEDVDH